MYCPTAYLADGTKRFFRLLYELRDNTELSVTMEMVQSRANGEVTDSPIPRKDVEWFVAAFDCLTSVAECGEGQPPCARATR